MTDGVFPRARALFRRHFWWLLVLAVIGCALMFWQWRGTAAPATKPLLVPVTRGDIENTVAAAGSLAPGRSVEVGAQVSGQLESLAVAVGDVVTEGQLLASIDASVQSQRVAASRASLQAQEALLSGRKAALELAEANVRRQRNMLEDQATSQQELETAVNALVSAQSSFAQLQAQIAQSRASLASDEAELGYSKIYAPIAGTVVSINVKEGQTLNAVQSAPLVMTIADLRKMTVETDVSEADVGKLRPGMPVYFTTLGNGQRRWHGQLRQVLPTPEVTNNVVLYTALFDVDNTDATLLSGMTAQVFFITSAARKVLTVPVAALRNLRPAGSQRQADVTVMGADGKPQDKTITVGISSRVQAEVVDGLVEGEQVVSGIAEAFGGMAAGRNGPPMGMRGFR